MWWWWLSSSRCIMMSRTVLGVRGGVGEMVRDRGGVVHLGRGEIPWTRSKVLVERIVRQLGEGRSSWLIILAKIVRGHQSVKERGFVIVIVDIGLAGVDDGETEQEPHPHTQHVLLMCVAVQQVRGLCS